MCGGEPNDPADRWTSYSDEQLQYSVGYCELVSEEVKWGYEMLDVAFEPEVGDIVYVLSIIYSDGDTFHHSEGHGTPVIIQKEANDAFKTKDQLTGLIRKYRKYDERMDAEKEITALLRLKGYSNGYIGFFGYFNSISECTLTMVHVER